MKKRLRLISFQLVLLLSLLLVVEFALRTLGYRPGDLKPNWLNFHPVDSLYVINDFRFNKAGIMIADSQYWVARNVHINEDGFRTADFNRVDSTKKKILFIGDSFTWGMSAKPMVGHCFVDLVRNETNYEVINLGIPATDPPQYYELAKKYIPRLKPDFVFVVFFMGNDLMEEDRQIIPGEPFYYYTNAGAVQADIDGVHFKTAQEAYTYLEKDKYYLHHPNNPFEWLVSKSALLSRLYSARYRLGEKLLFERTVKDTHITRKYLTGILSVAANNGVVVKFVLIPEVKEANKSIESYTKRYADILNNNELKGHWLILQNCREHFNDYPDGHLNNRGHRAYADFLEAFLKKNMETNN